MKQEMKRSLSMLFLAIEVNLVLWLAALGMTLRNAASPRTAVIVGFAFAAVVQHWAYYAVYKRAKETGT